MNPRTFVRWLTAGALLVLVLPHTAGSKALAATGTTELVSTGGFEGGLAPWSQSTANNASLFDTSKPHTGADEAWLCGYNNCNDQLWETVTVPLSFTALTLSYWLFINGQETATACNDSFVAQVRTSGGSPIASGPISCNTNATGGWVQRTVDLTNALGAYAGGTVQIYFNGRSDVTNYTNFYLDDVSLTAATTVALPPTNTPTSVPPTATRTPTGATRTPTKTPTRTATPTRTPTRTPGPTSTPGATNTPLPTATRTATPLPTATRTPTPPPTATNTPTSGSSQCTGSTTPDACIQYELNLLNTTRSQNGVPALTLNMTQTNGTGTCVGSYGHSTAMQQSGTIWHTNSAFPQASFPTNICLPYMRAGENVGEWQTGTETGDLNAMHNSMMGEAHDATTCATQVNHACNILDSRYSQVGIGIVRVNNVTWLTTDFVG